MSTSHQRSMGVDGLLDLSIRMSKTSRLIQSMLSKPGAELGLSSSRELDEGMLVFHKMVKLHEDGYLAALVAGQKMSMNPEILEALVVAEASGDRLGEVIVWSRSIVSGAVRDPDSAMRLSVVCVELGEVLLARAKEIGGW